MPTDMRSLRFSLKRLGYQSVLDGITDADIVSLDEATKKVDWVWSQSSKGPADRTKRRKALSLVQHFCAHQAEPTALQAVAMAMRLHSSTR